MQSRPLILYVDDEDTNRIVFEHALTEFHLETVASGDEALAVLAARDVAVLVTDMRMPHMNGEELLRIVKERHPHTIRMVLTAHEDIGPILRAINEGLVVRYIVKPWNREELAQVLRWACETWRFAHASSELYQRALSAEHLINLGTLAALAIHDLQNPLTSINAPLDNVRELAASSAELRAAVAMAPFSIPNRGRLIGLVAGLEETASEMKQALAHLDVMISDLKRLGKPPDPSAPVVTDPLPVVQRAISACSQLIRMSESSIRYEGPHKLPHVRMAAPELRHVLINVLTNGAHALGARGERGGRISVHANTDDDGMLALEVRDNGPGMPEEVLARAGTPFFTTREGGTGLGLTQCHRLLGPAGGRLRIASEQGVGTTVTILVPTTAIVTSSPASPG